MKNLILTVVLFFTLNLICTGEEIVNPLLSESGKETSVPLALNTGASVAAMKIQSADQWTSPQLADFEQGSITPFEFTFDGASAETAKSNPNKAGINNSTQCLYANYSGMDWWYKAKLNVKQNYVIVPNTANHKYLHFLLYRNVIARSEVQVYDDSNSDTRIYQKQFTNTITNAWEEVVFDLTASDAGLPGIEGKMIGNLWIMTSLDYIAGQFYYDSFVLSDSKDPIGLVRNITNLGDFENGFSGAIIALGTQTDGATASIENNPLATDKLNKTSKAIKYVRPGSAANWQSLRLFLDGFTGVGSPNKYLHFMMYNPANQKISVVINNVAGDEFIQEVVPVQNTAWADYVVDLGSFENLSNIKAINIRMPEDQNDNTYYFDQIILSNTSTPHTASQTSFNAVPAEDVVSPVCSSGKKAVNITQIEAGNEVKLFDMVGRLIYEGCASGNQITIPCLSKVGIIHVIKGGNKYIYRIAVLD